MQLLFNKFVLFQHSVTQIKSGLLVSVLGFALVGCQSQPITTPIKNSTPVFTTTTDPSKVTDKRILFLSSRLPTFSIQGKIGVVTPETPYQQQRSGSAFYVWAQEDERFAIDITGALGIGHTVIEYNGQTATLANEESGIISADTPEQLFEQGTGWQVPISQFAFWISGSPAPSDNHATLDAYQRLGSTTNGEWSATFSYKDTSQTLPNKIVVERHDGYKVVLTITHNTPNFADANYQ